MRIILGSSSGRRLEILKSILPRGVVPIVSAPDIDEKSVRVSGASALTLAIARAKNETVQNRFAYAGVIITADTVAVTPDGVIREKPTDADQEREFLESYQHAMPITCVTSVVVTSLVPRWTDSGTATATVWFRSFDDARREAIVATPDFYGAAGGFIIEHPLMVDLIDKIEGDPETVQGLPGALVRQILVRGGIRW